MSRTRLAALTALILVVVSAAVFLTRRATGGVGLGGVDGESAWDVTLTARGKLDGTKNAAVIAASPPDFRRQHIFDEAWKSDELARREGRGRENTWKRRPGLMADAKNPPPYTLTYNFRCTLGTRHPTPTMRERTKQLDGPPHPESDGTRTPTQKIESNSGEVQELARDLTANLPTIAATDQYRAFYEYVFGLPFRETEGTGSALECLREGGDDTGRARLLVALCRSREISARVVTGFILSSHAPAAIHRWVEAFIRPPDGPEGHWVPADPTYGHFGVRGWPANYLIVRFDDEPVVHGPPDQRITLFARPVTERPAVDEPRIKSFWRAVSLAALPPAEQHLIKFLLLLPIATVVVSAFRVVIGVKTYGVFSPALLGLIFRDLRGLPWGLGIFAGTVLVGWMFRRVLDRYNLLLIPRAAVMLTLIIVFLIGVVTISARAGIHVTGYVALFPLIILTHIVERFWTVEAEDGTRASFKTLFGTLLVAVSVALVLSPDAVGRWLFHYPETLGPVIGVLLLLGRYTGYRLTELYRFQDVIEFQEAEPPPAASVLVSATPQVQSVSPGL